MTLFVHLYIVGFFRTVLIIAVIYFGIRLVTRYILPLFLEKKMKEMQQKMQEQENRKKRAGKREGEVTIEYDQKKDHRNSPDEGEYVDFEEVD